MQRQDLIEVKTSDNDSETFDKNKINIEHR